MKKKTIILMSILVVAILATTLCGCSFLGVYTTDRTPYYIEIGKVEDSSTASIVANNNIMSCTRVISQYYNGYASAGSGFVVTKDGYVVTNRHCVVNFASTNTDTTQNPTEKPQKAIYYVVFADNTKLEATLVSYSKVADLALLKINTYIDLSGKVEYQPVKLASESDGELYYGQKLYTIGNPEDMGLILTELMVSAPAIKLNSSDSFDSIILDGNINHGNSGGVLLNSYGNVVGVVYARVEGTNEDAYGIGCGIPLTALKEFLDGNNIAYTTA